MNIKYLQLFFCLLIFGNITAFATAHSASVSRKLPTLDVAVLLKKADSCYSIPQYDSAIAVYTQITAAQPAFATAWYKRGLCYQAKRSYQQAIADLSTAIGNQANFDDAYAARALCYQNLGVYTLAVNDYNKIIGSQSPSSVYQNRGYCYQKLGQNELAILDFSMAVFKNPGDTLALLNRAISYHQIGSNAAALKDLDKIIELNVKNKQVYFQMALCQQDQNNYQAAIDNYTSALLIDTGYTIASKNRAAAYYMTGNYSIAIKDYTRVIAKQPGFIEYFNRGLCYKNTGGYDLAVADFSDAIKLQPNDPQSFYQRGVCYRNTGQFDLALADLTKAISMQPNLPEAYLERARCYKMTGQNSVALSECNTAISMKPTFAVAIDERDQIIKNVADSAAIAQKEILNDNPVEKNADYYYKKGVYYYQNGNDDAALRNYDEAIKLNPVFMLAYQKRAMSYQRKRDHRNAIKDYAQAILLKCNDPSVFYNRGVLLELQGSFDNAILDYTQAIELDGGYVQGYFKRGVLFYRESNLDAAIKDYSTVIKLGPSNAIPWFSRGLAYYEQGNYNAAINDFNEAIRLKSTDQMVMLQKLAYIAINKYVQAKALPEISENTRNYFEDNFFNFLNKYIQICEYELSADNYKAAAASLQRLLRDYNVNMSTQKATATFMNTRKNAVIQYAHVLAKTGWVYEQMGDNDRALEFYKKAQVIDSNVQNVTQKISNVLIKNGYSEDHTPPQIRLLMPQANGNAYVNDNHSIFVSGTVTDQSGVKSVNVNGVATHLSEDGFFQTSVSESTNELVIEARDTRGNKIDTSVHLSNKIKIDNLNDTVPVISNNERYYAIFIACSNYHGTHWSALPSTVAEAEQLRTLLIEKYDFAARNIDTLYNKSKNEILSVLSNKLQSLTEHDNLLVFFGGHGYFKPEKNMAYWVPLQAGQEFEYISNNEINSLISGTSVKHILVMADACFSGAIRSGISTPTKYEYSFMSRQLLTSGGTEVVPGKSAYIPMVLTALSLNKEPYLSARQLYSMIFKGISDQTGNEPTLRDLQVNGSQGGQFYFKTKAK